MLTFSFVVPWFKEQRASKCVKETINGFTAGSAEAATFFVVILNG